jgi:hypothetical protein
MELHIGRRLVRFNKVQEGYRLKVTCEGIDQEDYHEGDIVVSCIYHDEEDSCCITSVDIIYLLERLIDDEFEVEEKNRIRRNLEGLRPTTVSKHKPGFEDFFQRIMDFPDPKPRNIEKDVKVFDWGLLPQALDKIISKYVSTADHVARHNRTHSFQLSLYVAILWRTPFPFLSKYQPQQALHRLYTQAQRITIRTQTLAISVFLVPMKHSFLTPPTGPGLLYTPIPL